MDKAFPSRALVAAVLALVACLALLGPGRSGWDRPLLLACEHSPVWLTVC
ncbi:MAG: hypothetical protein JWN67_3126 [Actinomycetia bacterium]|nr:hypothetical protein [Actinomycetes bacterium]